MRKILDKIECWFLAEDIGGEMGYNIFVMMFRIAFFSSLSLFGVVYLIYCLFKNYIL